MLVCDQESKAKKVVGVNSSLVAPVAAAAVVRGRRQGCLSAAAGFSHKETMSTARNKRYVMFFFTVRCDRKLVTMIDDPIIYMMLVFHAMEALK